uniref:Uncharacterized protein n=1 Tax=Arundo donax TaxID=35708 RepID=A0A0A9BLA9_ARUDO
MCFRHLMVMQSYGLLGRVGLCLVKCTLMN